MISFSHINRYIYKYIPYLRALEGEVLQPGEHPAAAVHRAHQLVGGAQADGEGQQLGVVAGALGFHQPGRSLQPANNLQPAATSQLSVCNSLHLYVRKQSWSVIRAQLGG